MKNFFKFFLLFCSFFVFSQSFPEELLPFDVNEEAKFKNEKLKNLTIGIYKPDVVFNIHEASSTTDAKILEPLYEGLFS